MRHFLLPGTVAELALGVFAATGNTCLITFPGKSHGFGASHMRTATGAVALATVTVATDKNRCATAGA